MKKILFFGQFLLVLGCYAQDTITVQTENSGSFQTITYETPVYDTVYSESSHQSAEGGTINLVVNSSSQRISQPKPKPDPLSIAVYPNPGNGSYELVSTHLFTQVMVYSILGESLLKQETKGVYRTYINITSLPKGVYFFKFVFGDGSSRTQRVIMQ